MAIINTIITMTMSRLQVQGISYMLKFSLLLNVLLDTYQYTYIIGKYQIYLFRNGKKSDFAAYNVHMLWLSCNVKKSKTTDKLSDSSIILIDSVLAHFPILIVTQHESEKLHFVK
jgi:hypothetical protein